LAGDKGAKHGWNLVYQVLSDEPLAKPVGSFAVNENGGGGGLEDRHALSEETREEASKHVS
jgi:hypothetical protein